MFFSKNCHKKHSFCLRMVGKLSTKLYGSYSYIILLHIYISLPYATLGHSNDSWIVVNGISAVPHLRRNWWACVRSHIGLRDERNNFYKCGNLFLVDKTERKTQKGQYLLDPLIEARLLWSLSHFLLRLCFRGGLTPFSLGVLCSTFEDLPIYWHD